jgi:sugar phosphate isomerase/epimerase
LGEGMVRFPEFLAELNRRGYDGWAVVEQDIDPAAGTTGEPLASAIASRRFLLDRIGTT